jgi:hypothetical protein
LLVAQVAGKVVHTPRFAHRAENFETKVYNHLIISSSNNKTKKVHTIARYGLIAHKANVAKQLIVVSVTVS